MRTNSVVALSLAVCLAIPRVALADDPAPLADSLFEEARRLGFEEGKWAEACPKFAESHRLRPGGGVVLNLAHCYRSIGRTASAYARYKEGLALALRDKNDARVKLATDAIAELEPQLSRLTIVIQKGADVPGLSLQFDEQPLARAAWGTAFAIDPGQHTVIVSAPNKVEHRHTIVIGAAENKSIEIVPLRERPPVTPALTPTDSHGTRRLVGIVSAGVGLLSLGVGAYFGLRALDARNDSRARGCVPGDCPDPAAAELTRDASTYGNVSTVAVGVGLVGLAIGGYLFFTSPRPTTAATVSFDRNQVSFTVLARF